MNRFVVVFLLIGLMFGQSTVVVADDDGFVSIFDGKSLKGWKGNREFWTVENGAIVGTNSAEKPLKKNNFLVWSGGTVSDFELKFKFKISGEGANSGVQFRCRQDESGHLIGYQADIDHAGQWLGIIYDEKTGRGPVCDRGEKVVIDPVGNRDKKRVADRDSLFRDHVDISTWNDYSIRAIGNQITIRVNGKVTAELTDYEKGHADLDGILGLQLHQGPPMEIAFKNILLKKIPPQADDDGFKSLFDGVSLKGWSGNEKFWRVEEGAIVGESTEENKVDVNRFLVWDDGEVDDFVLKLKYKVSGTERANSGVQFRSQIFNDEKDRLAGYQADIDRSGKFIGILYSERTGRGILCQRGNKVTIRGKKDKTVEKVGDPAEILKSIDMDGWNEMEIMAQGNRFVIKINGKVTSEVIDEDEENYLDRGKIGFQIHVGPPMKIEFKDIRLKRLPLTDGIKKVVFIAGTPSHGYGAHEHNAGCLLLAKCLENAAEDGGLPVLTAVYRSGFPRDPTAVDNADTVVVYCDGGGRHFLHHNGEAFENIMRNGTGLACIHYGVEVPKGLSGQRFLNWIGGYFETNWSVNPHWTAKFSSFPDHPISNGVQPFEVRDEWYYHMRFSPMMTRVTPILSSLPPKETLTRKDGPHSNNPHVRKAVLEDKNPQHVAWAFERGDGKGRGFGFTGGHFHNNWANDNFRRLVLNAIAWTAHVEVPQSGIASATPTQQDLEANQDYPKKRAKKNKKPVKS
ncbi:MAG: family 16 glycoside hydrolase [Planctomycetota bacterium]